MTIILLMPAVAVVAASIAVVVFCFIVVVVWIKAEQDSSICEKVHVKKSDVVKEDAAQNITSPTR